jgi:flagellar biosynthesis/type III secretory pathway chaperone
MHDRLSRLLGACELLSREETAALTARDFVALSRALDLKASILADLAVEARQRSQIPPMARVRISRLLDRNIHNHALLSTSINDASADLRRMTTAGRQLELLREAYDVAAEPPASFSAHG